MFKLFSRRRKAEREIAPQLTTYERRALEIPGAPPGPYSLATYDLMERDSMIQTALTIKKLAVMAENWSVEPADGSSEAKERVDFVFAAFDRMEGAASTILHQAMDAFAKGWSIQELVYTNQNGRVWLEAVRPKNPGLFGLEVNAFGKVSGLRLQIPGEAEESLPRDKFIIFTHRSGYGRSKGKSDLDSAYPHWKSKQTLLNAWRIHLERYASPTVLGRYQRGLSAEEQSEIIGALRNLQDNTAIVFPNEIEIATLGGSRDGSTGFMEAIEFHNREIARAILGQTLTTDEGRRVGSLALGKVHLQVLLLQIQALRKELADSVMTEQVIRPLVEMNFGPGLVPKFTFAQGSLDAFSRGTLS